MRYSASMTFAAMVCLVLAVMPRAYAEEADAKADTHEREVVVIYQREVTDAERARYEIGTTSWWLPVGTTLNDIVEKYKDKDDQQNWKTIKMVAVKEGNRVHLDTTSLGHDLIRQRQEQQWLEGPGQQFLVDAQKHGFKQTDKMIKWIPATMRIYAPGSDHLGFVKQTLTREDGSGISSQVTIVPGDGKLSVHEFLREIVRYDFKLQQTSIGPVLVGTDDPPHGLTTARGGVGRHGSRKATSRSSSPPRAYRLNRP